MLQPSRQTSQQPLQRPRQETPRWVLGELAGRLSELSGYGPSAQLSLAFSMVLDAQERSEPVAWVSSRTSTFFPPDAAANGVDLSALPVIFVPDAPSAARAAERLGRSGAFGLIVLDLIAPGLLTPRARVPAALQSRLTGLALRHDMAVLCLTGKEPEAASLGALVSLRCHARREDDAGGFSCRLEALKDKRRGPGWQHAEFFHGPGGLR